MGFFDRNRRQLEARGIDPDRLPPGQYATDRFPVLHVGDVPRYADDLSDWDLRITGSVEQPLTLDFDELRALVRRSLTPRTPPTPSASTPSTRTRASTSASTRSSPGTTPRRPG